MKYLLNSQRKVVANLERKVKLSAQTSARCLDEVLAILFREPVLSFTEN